MGVSRQHSSEHIDQAAGLSRAGAQPLENFKLLLSLQLIPLLPTKDQPAADDVLALSMQNS